MNELTYSLTEDFIPVPDVATQKSGNVPPVQVDADNIQRVKDITELRKWNVPERVLVIAERGRHPDETKEDDSRSAWQFDLVCQCVRHKVPDEIIYAVITDKNYAISESVLDKGRQAHKYALKQIKSAKEFVAKDEPKQTVIADSLGISWEKTDKDGFPLPFYRNTLLAIPALGIECWHNAHNGRDIIGGQSIAQYAGDVTDKFIHVLRELICERFSFNDSLKSVADAVTALCLRDVRHPPQDYLNSLKHDGIDRLDTWGLAVLGLSDTRYNRAVCRLMILALVWRIMEPGCKLDYAFVLEGAQGIRKSTFCEVLAIKPEWFSDSLSFTQGEKEQIELMMGKVVVELAEQASSRAEVNRIKAFLARRWDRVRMAYARTPEEFKRGCIFVVTTNEASYQKDDTGNRRWLPMAVKDIDIDGFRKIYPQLLAEAVVAYRDGELPYLSDPEVLTAQAEQNKARSDAETDPWLDQLGQIVPPFRFGDESVDLFLVGGDEAVESNTLLRALEVPADRWKGTDAKRVAKLMNHLSWNGPKPIKVNGRVIRGYRRKADLTGAVRNLAGEVMTEQPTPKLFDEGSVSVTSGVTLDKLPVEPKEQGLSAVGTVGNFTSIQKSLSGEVVGGTGNE